ncbi:hypothetical protein LWC33_28925 [Pseudonocardia sp. RS11V-5]|uniref:hypothetical protein n=1 Tax=Pseudonocardia terrae TaxID=2905831 RepID=UPI001E547499|nr:hypothetical protein [Pseudonocardia terrae]MCE3555457.1 hypothetical protein [Pseudonocardia terrae]
MTIGPVQMLVLGFDHPDFQGGILAELERLREDDRVRVIDFLAVQKAVGGEVSVLKASQVDTAERAEFGAVVGALVGIATGRTAEEGAAVGAESTPLEEDLLDEEAWDALADIPEGTAAALVLLEHRWAIPLHDAVARAGGIRLASEFVSPLDLVDVGLVAAQEAEAIVAMSEDTI